MKGTKGAGSIEPPDSGPVWMSGEGRDRGNVVGDGAEAVSPQYTPKESQRRRSTAVHRIATRGRMNATVPRAVGSGQQVTFSECRKNFDGRASKLSLFGHSGILGPPWRDGSPFPLILT